MENSQEQRRGGSTRRIVGAKVIAVPSPPPERETGDAEPKNKWRFFLYSAIGSFAFFVPFTVGENNTILLLSLIHISEPTRRLSRSRMPSSA